MSYDHARVLRSTPFDCARGRPDDRIRGRVANGLRRKLWSGDGKKGQDIGPFRFPSGKIAKNLGKFRPGTEAALEGSMVKFSEVPVGATGGDFAVSANSVAPIFEEFAVLEAQVQRVGAESGSSNGIIPSGEKLSDLMLGDF